MLTREIVPDRNRNTDYKRNGSMKRNGREPTERDDDCANDNVQ